MSSEILVTIQVLEFSLGIAHHIHDTYIKQPDSFLYGFPAFKKSHSEYLYLLPTQYLNFLPSPNFRQHRVRLGLKQVPTHPL